MQMGTITITSISAMEHTMIIMEEAQGGLREMLEINKKLIIILTSFHTHPYKNYLKHHTKGTWLRAHALHVPVISTIPTIAQRYVIIRPLS